MLLFALSSQRVVMWWLLRVRVQCVTFCELSNSWCKETKYLYKKAPGICWGFFCHCLSQCYILQDITVVRGHHVCPLLSIIYLTAVLFCTHSNEGNKSTSSWFWYLSLFPGLYSVYTWLPVFCLYNSIILTTQIGQWCSHCECKGLFPRHLSDYLLFN